MEEEEEEEEEEEVIQNPNITVSKSNCSHCSVTSLYIHKPLGPHYHHSNLCLMSLSYF